MTNAKKTVHTAAKAGQSATKTAANATEEAVRAGRDNVASFAATSDQLSQSGTEAVREFLTTSAHELQRNQEKAFSFGREHIEKLSESADKASRTFGEAFSASKEHVDALLESTRLATELGKELQEQLVADTNELFNEHVELSKELLACRNLQEAVELQGRAIQANFTCFFNNSARLTEAWFRLATEVSEPLNAQGSQLATRLNKAFNS